jgi:hypothetical protein
VLVSVLNRKHHATQTVRTLAPKEVYKVSEIDQILHRSQPGTGQESTVKKISGFVQPSMDFDELSDSVRNDDICKIQNSSLNLNDIIVVLLSSNGFEKPDSATDKLFIEAFQSDVNARSQESEIVIKLYNALLFADLFYGEESPQVDYKKAHDLFLELSQLEPNNALFPFLDSYVLSKLGASDEQIRNSFYSAFLKPELNYYMDKLGDRLFEKSTASASHLLLQSTASDMLHDVNFALPVFFLFHFIDQKDADFNRAAISFAKKLTPLTDQENINSIPRWKRPAYMFAEKIISRAWSSAYPNSTKPFYPKLKPSFLVNREAGYQLGMALYDEGLAKTSDNLYTCHREKFDVFFAEHKVRNLNPDQK